MKKRFNCQYVRLLGLSLGLAACTPVPDLPASDRPGTTDVAALAWPEILPMDQITAVSEAEDPRVSEVVAETDALLARAESLRARAAALAAPVLSADDRTRLTPR